ncbi:MAG TPA: CBS domain-containing protein [Polyangia bacterium]
MSKVTLRSFMTHAPHTVGAAQTLATARELMRRHHIRHLPVLDAGQLVGILSERDLLLVAGLPGVELERVAVSEAMTPDPRCISPDSSLEWVAAEMAQARLGSIVIVEGERVVGIFTTVDALRALGSLLARARRRHEPKSAPPPQKTH